MTPAPLLPSAPARPDPLAGGGASRPAATTAAAVAVLTLAAWGALLAEALRSGAGADALLSAICRPTALDGGAGGPVLAGFGFAAALWSVMTVAMMLPTAAPMALAYAGIVERRSRDGQRSASPLTVLAGYLAVWIAVAILAALAQTVLAGLASRLALPPNAAGVLAGFAMGAAGLYQFSDWKDRCLAVCRRPDRELERGAGPSTFSGLRLGVEQGRACLGCCAATMGLMLLAGSMNLVWMAALASLAMVEKMSAGRAVPRAIGAGLIAAGLAVAVSAVGPEAVLRALTGR
ncbi:DUF2182 domain-containing protein [Alsobacter sp. KACC 23698]|uniref:DUF2182 domain-containing protein n=1 Tax=Alsobacter sp. KACC 23698 TaxID=3149229 RepID=A0AAU7JKR8_9HYPH